MANGMSGQEGDVTQRLEIEAAFTDVNASEGMTKILADFARVTRAAEESSASQVRSGAVLTETREQQIARIARLERETTTAGQASAQAAVRANEEVSASTAEILRLKSRFADTSRIAAEGQDAETVKKRDYVAEVKREVAALADLQRANEITLQQRAQMTRDLSLKIPRSAGDELLSKDTIRSGALAGNDDSIARYRAQLLVEQEAAKADRELTTTVLAGARTRADAVRTEMRLGQLSREEEGQSLRALLVEYRTYGEARALIEQRITENTIQQTRERERAERQESSAQTREGKATTREVGGALINASYMLPGPLGTAAQTFGYAGGSPLGLGLAAGLVGGGAAIGGAFAAAKAAGDEEQSMRRLAISVTNVGGSYTRAREEIEHFAELQARTTTFGREETIPGLRALVDGGLKLEDAFKVLRVSEDLSAGSGKTLEQTTQALRAAYEGNSRGLVSLGLATKEQIKDGMSFQQVLETVEKRMHGQAEATDTLEGRTAQFSNAVKQLEVDIGDWLIKSLTDGTTSATKFIQSIDGKAIGHGLSDAIAEQTRGVKDLIKTYKELENQLAPVDKGLNDLAKDFDTLGKQQHDTLVNAGTSSAFAIGAGEGWASTLPERSDYVGGVYSLPKATSGGGDSRSSYESMTVAAARRAKVDPRLALALVYQESGFNPAAVSSAGALGLGQLMPGTAAELGVTNALDPQQNLSGSMRHLGQMLERYHGNQSLALTAYNVGPGNVDRYGDKARFLPGADPNYASGILAGARGFAQHSAGGAGFATSRDRGAASLDPNFAYTDVQGAQRPPTPGLDDFQKDLMAYQNRADAARILGVKDYRATYEAALISLRDREFELSTNQDKSRSERDKALREYHTAVKLLTAEQLKDQAELKHGEVEKQREIERGFQSSLLGIEIDRKAKHESVEQETKALQDLRATRTAEGGPGMERDVQRIDAVIAHLGQTVSQHLASITRTYQRTTMSLDDYLAKIAVLNHGATAADKADIEAKRVAAIEGDATKFVKDSSAPFNRANRTGATRADLEAISRAQLASIAGRRNQGDSTAADTYSQGGDAVQSRLSGYYNTDATAEVTKIERAYREMFTTVASGTATKSEQERIEISLLSQQRTELEALAKTYRDRYGTEGLAANESIQKSLETLAVKQHDMAAQATRDERKELEARAASYATFADTASASIAKLVGNGRNGFQNLGDMIKSTVKDGESAALKSSISSMLFPQGGSTGGLDIMGVLQKSMLGGEAPKGFFGSAPDTTTNAMRALERFATRGTVAEPLVVRIAGDSGTSGAAGGASDLSGAISRFGVTGVLLGPAAGGILSSLPTGGGVLGTLFGAGTIAAAATAGSPASAAYSIGPPSGASAYSMLMGSAPGAYPMSLPGTSPYAGVQIPGGRVNADGSLSTFNLPFNAQNIFGANNATRFGGALTGFGYGEAANAFMGGNSLYGTAGSGVGAGIGAAFGGPVGAKIGGTLGGIVGGLFGPHFGPPENYPDRSDPARYGTAIADLTGAKAGVSGRDYYAETSVSARTQGLGEINTIEKMLSQGEAAFVAATGLNHDDYARALGFFGASATGAGVLKHGTHIGDLSVSGATGAGKTMNYVDAQTLAQSILNGSGPNNGPINSYSISRSLPDFNLTGISSPAAAFIASIASGGPNTNGYGASGITVPNPNYGRGGVGAAPGGPSSAFDSVSPIGGADRRVVIDARGATFNGIGGVADLVNLVETGIARKGYGSAPNPRAGIAANRSPVV